MKRSGSVVSPTFAPFDLIGVTNIADLSGSGSSKSSELLPKEGKALELEPEPESETGPGTQVRTGLKSSDEGETASMAFA